MHALPKFNPLHSKMDCIAYNDRIKLAVADLESQESLNYAQTAKKWNVDRSTLSRRHKSITGSKQDQYSYTLKALTDVQENVLVRYINELSARGLSPTSQIVKNLAEELAGKDVAISHPC
jgi:Tc5 transposase DNA-binding domain